MRSIATAVASPPPIQSATVRSCASLRDQFSAVRMDIPEEFAEALLSVRETGTFTKIVFNINRPVGQYRLSSSDLRVRMLCHLYIYLY